MYRSSASTVAEHQQRLPARRGRPPRLTRAAILATALKLIDEDGAQALTMRRLGAELGVEAMSLYRHVSNKDALLDGIAEQLMLEVAGPRDGNRDWADTARQLAIGTRAVARAHPAAFELVGLRALNTQDALRPVERLLTDLRSAGFSAARAVGVYRLLASYTRGFLLIEIAGFTLAEVHSDDDPSRLSAQQLPAEDFPMINELADELGHDATDAHFGAGLDTILAGLHQELKIARTR